MMCRDQKAGQLSYMSIVPPPGLHLYAGYIIDYLFNELADFEIIFSLLASLYWDLDSLHL